MNKKTKNALWGSLGAIILSLFIGFDTNTLGIYLADVAIVIFLSWLAFAGKTYSIPVLIAHFIIGKIIIYYLVLVFHEQMHLRPEVIIINLAFAYLWYLNLKNKKYAFR